MRFTRPVDLWLSLETSLDGYHPQANARPHMKISILPSTQKQNKFFDKEPITSSVGRCRSHQDSVRLNRNFRISRSPETQTMHDRNHLHLLKDPLWSSSDCCRNPSLSRARLLARSGPCRAPFSECNEYLNGGYAICPSRFSHRKRGTLFCFVVPKSQYRDCYVTA